MSYIGKVICGLSNCIAEEEYHSGHCNNCPYLKNKPSCRMTMMRDVRKIIDGLTEILDVSHIQTNRLLEKGESPDYS